MLFIRAILYMLSIIYSMIAKLKIVYDTFNLLFNQMMYKLSIYDVHNNDKLI